MATDKDKTQPRYGSEEYKKNKDKYLEAEKEALAAFDAQKKRLMAEEEQLKKEGKTLSKTKKEELETAKKEITNARKRGVDRFWIDEKERIQKGEGTFKWSKEEQDILLNGDKKAVDDLKSQFEVHHTQSVDERADLAADPQYLQALKKEVHQKAHNESFSIDPETGKKIVGGGAKVIDLNKPADAPVDAPAVEEAGKEATTAANDATEANKELATAANDAGAAQTQAMNDGAASSAPLIAAMGGVAGAMEDTAGASEDLGDAAGDALNEMADGAADAAEGVSALGGAVREVTSTSDELASLASGFGDISGQLGAIADGFDSIDEFKDSAATVGEGIKGLFSGEKGSGKKIFQGLSGMAGAASKGLDAAAKAQKLLNVQNMKDTVIKGIQTVKQIAYNIAAAANPTTLIILGIIALIAAIVLLIKNWDKIKEVMQKVWEKIKEIWGKVAEWFKTNIIDPIVEFFTGLGASIAAAITWVVEKAKEIFGIVVDWIKTNIIDPIVEFFTGLGESIAGAFTWAVEKAKEIFGTVADWINTNVIEPIAKFFTGLWDGIKSGVDTVLGFFQKLNPKNWFGGKADVKVSANAEDGGIVTAAAGGIFSGPKRILVGEYAGAGTNPEVVAPLDKLRGIMAGDFMQGMNAFMGAHMQPLQPALAMAGGPSMVSQINNFNQSFTCTDRTVQAATDRAMQGSVYNAEAQLARAIRNQR